MCNILPSIFEISAAFWTYKVQFLVCRINQNKFNNTPETNYNLFVNQAEFQAVI